MEVTGPVNDAQSMCMHHATGSCAYVIQGHPEQAKACTASDLISVADQKE